MQRGGYYTQARKMWLKSFHKHNFFLPFKINENIVNPVKDKLQ